MNLPNTADIRQFLMDAYSDESFNALCYDYFRGAYDNFTIGMSKGQKIQQLIEYSLQHYQMEDLIERLRKQRPEQFERWLSSTTPPSEVLTEPSGGQLRPFKRGLKPYDVEEADIFLGRWSESEKLFRRICEDRLVVVTGWSGCGKSSLVKAGVIPRLQAAHYPTIYCQVRESILHDVLTAINIELDVSKLPRIDDLEQLPKAVVDLQQTVSLSVAGKFMPLVLLIDQFDQILNRSHSVEVRNRFLKTLVALLESARHLIKVVIIARPDWYVVLDESLQEFDWNQISLFFRVDYFTKEEARHALIEPLEKAGLPYEETVVQDILQKLIGQSNEVVTTEGMIQPVHLQLVSDALITSAEQRGNIRDAFSHESYVLSGGVESIIRNYVARKVRDRDEIWRLLSHFVTSDGRSSHSLRRIEAIAIPSLESADRELDDLVRMGLIQMYEDATGQETYYRLSHEYLVEAITAYLTANADRHGWKLAVDWLTTAVSEQKSADAGQAGELLLDQSRYQHIYQFRRQIDLVQEEARLILIRSALRYGHEGFAYWLTNDVDVRYSELQIVANQLISPEPEVKRAARTSVAGAKRITGEGTAVLDAKSLKNLHDRLQPAFEHTNKRSEREAAAQALWIVGDFDSTSERLSVVQVLSRKWLRDHSRPVALYFGSLLMLILAIGGFLYAQDRLRGVWIPIDSLKGGQIPLIWTATNEDATTYVISFGDNGSLYGASLYVWNGDYAELRSRDFSKSWPTAMTVTPKAIYIAIYGQGISRSTDGGYTWQLINRGLPSRGITSIQADPTVSETLFIGTNDFRGVLRSDDSGDSWEYYDYGGEIFGAQITALAYTTSDEGMLLAGTADGQILGHSRNSSEWTLLSNWGRGSIAKIVVAKSDPMIVYAGTNRGFILRSQDGGRTWPFFEKLSNQFFISTIVIDPREASHLFAGSYGNGGNTVWESYNAGQNWEPTDGMGITRDSILTLAIAGEDTSYLLGGTASGLFTSTNNGKAWQAQSLETPLAAIQGIAISDKAPAPIYAFRSGSVYTNLRGDLDEWTIGKGLDAEFIRTVVADPNNSYIAYAGVLLLGRWSVYKTQDGGQSWLSTTSPNITPNVPDTTALAIARKRDGEQSVLYAGTAGCGLFRSNNGGVTWDTFGRSKCSQTSENGMPSDISFLAVDAVNTDKVYAATGQQVFHTTDGGQSWRTSSPPISSPIRRLAADPVQADAVYLIAGLSGFWRSSDGGETWQQMGKQWLSDSELTTLETMADSQGHLIVGATNGSIWLSLDGGQTWQSTRENLAVSSITSIATSSALPGKILIGTFREGLAEFLPGSLFGSQP